MGLRKTLLGSLSATKSNGYNKSWWRSPRFNAQGEEASALPTELPLLPLHNAVLLPLGYLRLRIPSREREEQVLCRHLLSLQGTLSGPPSQDDTNAVPVVAAVPVVNAAFPVEISDDGTTVEPPSGVWQPQVFAGSKGKSKNDGRGASKRHLFPVGTAAAVLKVEKIEKDSRIDWEVLLEGLCRLQVASVGQSHSEFYTVEVRQLDEIAAPQTGDPNATSGLDELGELADRLRDLSRKLVAGLQSTVSEGAPRQHGGGLVAAAAAHRLGRMLEQLPPARAADVLAGSLADASERLLVLAAVDAKRRVRLGIDLATEALRALGDAGKATGVRGVGRPGESPQAVGPGEASEERASLEARLRAAEPPPEALEVGLKELAKLERMGESHPAASGMRSYVELIADLPWGRSAAATQTGPRSLADVKAMLDARHKGLGKVKQRILEYVAVTRLISRGPVPGPILCFIGPPGVGKTSLADAIAEVLGRPLARIALGGMRDEAEIRGHRRTYVGAMPGRVLQGIRRAKCRDPVMLLDEVDKMGHDIRGDPTSALLEVLDPAQNHSFVDTFLGLPFDLSGVVFVATANNEGAIPAPLSDRMEVIRLSGYTLQERLAIAQEHLVPRVLAAHGLRDGWVSFPAEALAALIRGWTREAGVRDLERSLAAVARSVALRVAARMEPDGGLAGLGKGAEPCVAECLVDEELLVEVLGPRRFLAEDLEQRPREPGAAAGLVWTPSGGSLQYVEACVVSRGHASREGRLTLTGQLGGVLEESALIALSWCRGNAFRLGLDSVPSAALEPPSLTLASQVAGAREEAASAPRDALPSAVFASDVHIHFPAGAIPKDGPSAGITLACALVSLFSGKPLRPDVAMTGELSLHGLVLPVGGIKEKLLAARQAGLASVILPSRNLTEAETEVPLKLREEMELVPCVTMDDVLAVAFKGGFPVLQKSRL